MKSSRVQLDAKDGHVEAEAAAVLNSDAILKIVFGMVGGLGIFVLGMKNMSDGMQAVAGESLRKMISTVTTNRLSAVGVGTAVTGVVQSSSITTVLVIGSVNSGVMTLVQAVGVILGANIGTTITGWFIALKIGKYGLPLLGSMAMAYLFIKGDRWRFWALTLMGVGMVFFGLELMKDACAGIKDMEAFEAWFHQFQANSFLGVWKCVLAGCILTVMVQSSSATLGITISLAFQGVISYETAAALVLGENIGTTITALLASIGATVNARRAAYFHTIFNITGVLWITIIFQWYVGFIPTAIETASSSLQAVGFDPSFTSGDVTEMVIQKGDDGKPAEVYPYTTVAIAATHSIFNVVNTLAFLPFLPFFVRFLERIVPSKEFKEKPHLTDLDVRMLETPALAIEQSRAEILKMGDGCHKMLEWLRGLLGQSKPDTALMDRIIRREKVLDNIQDEVAVFITKLLSGNVTHAVAEEARLQVRIADEYESVSDYITSIMKFQRRLHKDELSFTTTQIEQLKKLHDMVADYVDVVNEAFVQRNPDVSARLDTKGKHIRNEIKSMRGQHLEELSSDGVAPSVGVAFMAALNSYVRVRDHSRNIAEAVAGEK